MDLNRIIHEAVDARITEDFMADEVGKRVEKLVRDVLDDELRSYSDTGKLIREAVKDSLRVGRLDLPSYGSMVATMLQSKIDEMVQPIIAGKLAEDMEELLNLAPKTIKLSKIVEDMMKESGRYEDGEFGDLVTCIVGDTSYGSTWIHLDPREHYEEREKHLCDLKFLVSRESGKIFSGTVSGQDLGKNGSHPAIPVRFGNLHGTEQRILSYYACGTVIEIDEDNVTTYRDYD